MLFSPLYPKTKNQVQESQAIDALVSLGYSQNQAKEALNLVPKKFKNLEDKVKEAYFLTYF